MDRLQPRPEGPGIGSEEIIEPDELCSSAYLVTLALSGHYCINETINNAIWRIHDRFGVSGQDRMCALPPLRAYAGEDELAIWQQAMLQVEQNLMSEENRKTQDREDSFQQRFPWS